MSRLYCPTYLCLKEWRQLINIQDKLFKVELPTLLHVLCSIPPLKDMVTQEHLGEYQNIINEIFVTAPRAVMEENMLKIGEFSKLSRISIRMLRYYDDIGLIKPYFIDPVNGYRYYQEESLL